MTKPSTIVFALAGAIFVLSLGWLMAFRKPYDRPEYIEIDTSESAFLIPLEGDTHNQATFASAEFLDQQKVAVKRIRITHRWNQTGPLPSQGEWIATVRLIKVDRRPITREWTALHTSGTSSKNEAIAAESRDSVGFSVGISCTAKIPEDKAAVFLYSYPSKSLADMLDMEVRARVQQVVAEEAAKYDLDAMRSKKNEIMKTVKDDVTAYFKGNGIEISTIAMLGGITYENQEIQKAIDDAVKASQLKVSAEAKREAQEVDNKTLQLAAEGKAKAAQLEARGKADAEVTRAEAEAKARISAAEAEAEGIRKVAEARAFEVEKAMESPDMYARLKQIEIEVQRWKQWDGKYPAYLMQFGATDSKAGLLLQPPPLPEANRTLGRGDEKK